MIRDWLNKIIAGVGLLLAGLAWVWKQQRDAARDKAERYRRESEQAEARHEQRDRAARADSEGERKTNEARRQAREEAEQGKRDHFEDGTW
ncbi:hypothetical protein CAI21_21715 [Alkalilimnicola ehrlichii]|uniref:Uncharacterized protein n=1 Tax=Alkalilimnicola ehrlichii TaxID=351052 RepID=A0A3E0WT54_9GAMM|nr:hypothetical protein [Alkalilimnicola ehrlichii]RFA24443.1 hypothetical protein CAI21_21715 [Alkalilimnicola ehrlichii]RFA35147.1 hypothetical protein CAL65_13660 [Alkalilimnicola ehrlichii]